MTANPEFGQNEELLWFKEAAEARSKRKTDAAAENHGADEAGGDGCDVKVNEEGTRRGLPTPPRHHQCHERKCSHAGSYRWNWTADWGRQCQVCWHKQQALEWEQEEVERAVQTWRWTWRVTWRWTWRETWRWPTPPRHHQCDECKGWHAGSYRWNWTADSRWLCQSCWQRHQELQHQEMQHQELEQAVQMPVPDDDPMDVNE